MKSGSPSRTTAAHTKHKIKSRPGPLSSSNVVTPPFNPSEAPPWDSRPVSGAGVVHYHSLHRPRSVPTALGPAPLVTQTFVQFTVPGLWLHSLWRGGWPDRGFHHHGPGKSAVCSAVCCTPPPQPPHDTQSHRTECRRGYFCSHNLCNWNTHTHTHTHTHYKCLLNQSSSYTLY